jgi:uncharacterized membrane protein YpjA
MNKYLKVVLYGFVAWLIPFVASFLFYTSEGTLTVDVRFFKCVMVVIGTATAAVLLVSYFKKIDSSYLKEGIVVGLIWFAVNILLDVVILIPMSGMTLTDYFMNIGLGYLAMPAMSIMVGAALESKKT